MIKLSQASTTAQKPASSDMAAQALCEPAPSDATTLIANFMTGFSYRLSQRSRPVLAGYLRTAVPKYQEPVRLISDPNWPLLPWNICNPGINYPALIPIIARAYLLLTLSPMHALSSPPGINRFTHRTQSSRYNRIGAYTQGTDAQPTPRDLRAAPRA
jgi:hypothetical protein